MKKAKVHISCPSCGATIRIVGELEEVKVKSEIKEDEILGIFPASLRKKLNVQRIEGNLAYLEMRGSFDKKKFRELMIEVRGFGGRWVKGHFILPLPSV